MNRSGESPLGPRRDPMSVELLIKCLEQDLQVLKIRESKALAEKKDLIARLLMLKCQLNEFKES